MKNLFIFALTYENANKKCMYCIWKLGMNLLGLKTITTIWETSKTNNYIQNN